MRKIFIISALVFIGSIVGFFVGNYLILNSNIPTGSTAYYKCPERSGPLDCLNNKYKVESCSNEDVISGQCSEIVSDGISLKQPDHLIGVILFFMSLVLGSISLIISIVLFIKRFVLKTTEVLERKNP